MYLILNYKLNFDEKKNLEDIYEISTPIGKDILVELFDCEQLNKALKNNYSLGEDIHVYCIDGESLESDTDELNKTISYKFKIKSEVPFKLLKQSSKYINQNNFMVYKFCSTTKDLIIQNKWEQCIQGLVDSLDFETLIEVANFLKNIPKSTQDIDLINEAIEKIEYKALIESFNIDNLNIKDILKMQYVDDNIENIIISRVKSHIYSDSVGLEQIQEDICILKSVSHKDILKKLSSDYMNKFILIFSCMEANRKEGFRKIEILVEELIDFLKKFQYPYSHVEEKYNILIKQNKKLYF